MKACSGDLTQWDCTKWLNNPGGPPACAAIEDPCGSGNKDSSVPDGPVVDAPSKADLAADLFVVLPDTTSGACPYTTASFTCTTPCEKVYAVLQNCANDPTLPPNLQTLLKTMANVKKANAIAICKASCLVSYLKRPAQWRCFQAAPATKCNSGCTLIKCPAL